jgi:hypothetical protein
MKVWFFPKAKVGMKGCKLEGLTLLINRIRFFILCLSWPQRYLTKDGLGRIRKIYNVVTFKVYCGRVFVPAIPNSKCLSADIQLLMINKL